MNVVDDAVSFCAATVGRLVFGPAADATPAELEAIAVILERAAMMFRARLPHERVQVPVPEPALPRRGT